MTNVWLKENSEKANETVIPVKTWIYNCYENNFSKTFCIFLFPIINSNPAIIQTINNRPKTILPTGVEIPYEKPNLKKVATRKNIKTKNPIVLLFVSFTLLSNNIHDFWSLSNLVSISLITFSA